LSRIFQSHQACAKWFRLPRISRPVALGRRLGQRAAEPQDFLIGPVVVDVDEAQLLPGRISLPERRRLLSQAVAGVAGSEKDPDWDLHEGLPRRLGIAAFRLGLARIIPEHFFGRLSGRMRAVETEECDR